MNLITDTSRNVTLAKVAEERARTHPEDTALLFDSGLRLSYGDVGTSKPTGAGDSDTWRKTQRNAHLSTSEYPRVCPSSDRRLYLRLIINPVVPIYRGEELGFGGRRQNRNLVHSSPNQRIDFVQMIQELQPDSLISAMSFAAAPTMTLLLTFCDLRP